MGKTIVCHCEDVTLKDVLSAIRQGYGDVETLKRFTGVGTGPCQGKRCLLETLRVLASDAARRAAGEGRAAGPAEPLDPGAGLDVHLPTIRPPAVPVCVDALAAAPDPDPREDA